MNLEWFQTKFNSLDTIIKQAQKDISFLKEEATKSGFYFTNGEFKKPETILAYVLKYAYYSTYVGEKGAMYNGAEYAESLDYDDIVIDIKAWGEELIALQEKAVKCFEEATPGPSYKPNPMTSEEFESVFKKYSPYLPEGLDYPSLQDWKYRKTTSGFYASPSKMIDTVSYDTERYIKDCTEFIQCFSYENNQISYRYNGRSRQEEFVNNSGFTIGLFEAKYIDTFKEVSYEDEFDVYSHADEVKW